MARREWEDAQHTDPVADRETDQGSDDLMVQLQFAVAEEVLEPVPEAS